MPTGLCSGRGCLWTRTFPWPHWRLPAALILTYQGRQGSPRVSLSWARERRGTRLCQEHCTALGGGDIFKPLSWRMSLLWIRCACLGQHPWWDFENKTHKEKLNSMSQCKLSQGGIFSQSLGSVWRRADGPFSHSASLQNARGRAVAGTGALPGPPIPVKQHYESHQGDRQTGHLPFTLTVM